MSAEARVFGLLLCELADAMIANGILRSHEVAGALLRTEHRAELDDAFNDEDVMAAASGFAGLLTEEWQSRLGLLPDVVTLRSRHTDWLRNGSKGTAALDVREVKRLYGDPAPDRAHADAAHGPWPWTRP